VPNRPPQSTSGELSGHEPETRPGSGPLAGVLVLDLTRVLAGPYCTMVLSDLGARVIKVERPGTGDDSREIGPFIDGESAYFLSLNRGKESIALDLKDHPGAATDRAIFERLLARADVLVENFRPGTMEKLGYGWDALHARYPRLIYAAASGFGHTGPYARRPAYDMVVQGMGGIMSLTGQPGGEPTRVGSSIGDISAGLFTAIGVNAALFERGQNGLGQKIDVSMLDSQIAILENAIARYQSTGEVPGPLGARHPSITPFGAFRTRDGHVIIAAGNDRLFETLCRTLDRPDLPTRSEFASNELRTQHHEQLREELEATLSQAETRTWLTRFEAAEIPCSPINDVAEALADPQVRARNMVVDVPRSTRGGGEMLQIAGNPIKLSGAHDPATRPAAPALDADRESLLREFAPDLKA
jgi:CoA:oxalate CoA-transferase